MWKVRSIVLRRIGQQHALLSVMRCALVFAAANNAMVFQIAELRRDDGPLTIAGIVIAINHLPVLGGSNLSHVRKPAVAGRFYPADADELRADIDAYLAQARPTTARPKAIIAPHAGYIYSGPVAAAAYAAVRNVREFVNRVVLLGPAHRVPFEGLATTTKEAFETPLGIVPVDTEAVAMTLAFPQAQAFDAADHSEHSLEVHLPFLQRVLRDFKIVPFVVGDATPQQVGEMLDALWGGDETLIVISPVLVLRQTA